MYDSGTDNVLLDSSDHSETFLTFAPSYLNQSNQLQ